MVTLLSYSHALWFHTIISYLVEDIFNTLRPRQKGRLFPDNIFNCVFLNENISISISISLQFVVPKGHINNIPALVQKMAWRRLVHWRIHLSLGLSELMHTHIASFPGQYCCWTNYFFRKQNNDICSYIRMCVCEWNMYTWFSNHLTQKNDREVTWWLMYIFLNLQEQLFWFRDMLKKP